MLQHVSGNDSLACCQFSLPFDVGLRPVGNSAKQFVAITADGDAVLSENIDRTDGLCHRDILHRAIADVRGLLGGHAEVSTDLLKNGGVRLRSAEGQLPPDSVGEL